MKKTFLLSILFLSINISFSQTKKETEDWINQNINEFPLYWANTSLNVIEKIYVENGYLYNYYLVKDIEKNYYAGYWTKVALKDIKSIENYYHRSSDPESNWIELRFTSAKGKCFKAERKKEYVGKMNVKYQVVPEEMTISQRLNLDFENSGMKKRIEKALLHLIKLYGGNAIVKREPF